MYIEEIRIRIKKEVTEEDKKNVSNDEDASV